jgi:hypothetical protein
MIVAFGVCGGGGAGGMEIEGGGAREAGSLWIFVLQ